ncbi:formin-like protein 5 [Arachis ipaensis]|uniref:formin-like protein 5 n=1 Tax=Arachis ipaensis TaxID=130454 RepID=UPI000A2B126F|nr:formin-like protein 5 [Arachis ipaensis]
MEEVCDALYEGNELPVEFLQTLLKMAPTTDEQLKLRLFTGELSQLSLADQFLKAMVDIPFAFKRMEALLFLSTLKEELNSTIEPFAVLENTMVLFSSCSKLHLVRQGLVVKVVVLYHQDISFYQS